MWGGRKAWRYAANDRLIQQAKEMMNQDGRLGLCRQAREIFG